jgi:peptidoglycan hydrolase CwlO-like protein
MRKLIPIALIALVILYFQADIKNAYEEFSTFSFCENTIGYYVGPIDPQFAADRQTVIEQAKLAANIWNDEYDFPLFEYNEEADLVIRLVFDERQRKINEITKSEAIVNLDKYELTGKIEKYAGKYQTLKSAMDELNRQVEYWNSKGGAAPGIYNKLIEQQEKLNLQVDDLNKVAESLDQASTEANQKIDSLNETITNFNKILDLYPEEGLYNPNEDQIDIYFYDNENRFVHTVAHELGHALGLGHVLEEIALMHPTTSENLELTEEDTRELGSFCAENDRFEFLKENWELVLRNKIINLQAK